MRGTQAVVWRFCANLSSRQGADDLTQEVYIRATPNIGQYRVDAPVVSWLLSITRHVCADQVRKNSADLVDSLDPDRKLAFVLTQVLGLSYEEAAAVCECPIGTIALARGTRPPRPCRGRSQRRSPVGTDAR